MSNNTELFDEIAIKSGVVERTFSYDGKSVTLCIARWRDIGQTSAWQRAVQGREKALKAQKGRLAVTLAPELAEHFADTIKDSKPLKDGKLEVYVTSQEELFMASILEYGVVDSETETLRFSWPEAVLFGKLNWNIAVQATNAIREINELEAKEAAKKDSTTEDSEDSADS